MDILKLMNGFGTRYRRAIGAMLASGLLVSCAQTPGLRDDARQLVAAGEYEQAISRLQEGLAVDPGRMEWRAALLQTREEALLRLVAEAAAARATGRFDEARRQLERARGFDVGGQRVQALLTEVDTEQRQQQALLDAQAAVARGEPAAARGLLAEALKLDPRQPELLRLQRELESDARRALQQAARLGLFEKRPISLDFRDASLRTVLDVVTRHSGIDFVLDKDIAEDVRVTLLLRDTPVEQAIELIVGTYGLAKKVANPRTILVYPNTQEKQREHQEQVVRVFHLASADAKAAAGFLRAMMTIKDPYVDERSNMLAIRETPEQVELAERLIALYDTQEPEVLLELEVLEVRSSRLSDIGIKFPESLSLTPLSASGGASGLTWNDLRNLNGSRIGVGVAGLLLNFKREIGDFQTLANPRVRVRSKQKANVLIGDKVPVVTTTLGQGAFVSDSVNYLDVGLKLEVEPTVYADDEVAIRVGLEVSSIAREVRTTTGSLAYQIGTRNAGTSLRLRDGETQLLAGLISREDRNTSARLPGLGDLPVAGRIFSSQHDEGQRTELVLAITPRILRNVQTPDPSRAELWVGTEATPRLKLGPGLPPLAAAGAAMPALEGGQRATAESHAPAAAAVEPSLRLGWQAPPRAAIGQRFVIELIASSDLPLRGGPMQLKYDPARLEVLAVTEGDYLKQTVGATQFTRAIDRGSIRAGMLRNAPDGVRGSGSLLRIEARALAAGPVELTLESFEPIVVGARSARTVGPGAAVVAVD